MNSKLCPHLHKQLFRQVISDGRTQIVEKCLDCGANARGSSVWVPRREVRVPIEDLPLLPGKSAPGTDVPRQADLFGDVS